MIYLNSKYLSKKLNINLAKWKRWSRQFLDPDPLGGYQSGVARQFSHKDAFRVFFGGHLVGELKFTIPQASQILLDLDAWLKKNHLYDLPKPDRSTDCKSRRIYIYGSEMGRFGYAVRTVIQGRTDNAKGLQKEIYEEELIGLSAEKLKMDRFAHARVVYIDTLMQYFIDNVN